MECSAKEFLLATYKANINNVGPLKTFRTKKDLWANITEKCNTKLNLLLTSEQVEGRFKSVIRKTKKIIQNNRTSGGVRQKIEFDEMSGIIDLDDSLVPSVYMGPNRMVTKANAISNTDISTPSTSTATSTPLTSTATSTPLTSTATSEPPPYVESPIPSASTSNSESPIMFDDLDNFSAPKRRITNQEKIMRLYVESKKEIAREKELKKRERHDEKMKLI